ncbi:histone acetyltransferase, partial [bacterium]|nr:histone acetyltransferase [bacterium]
MSELIASLIAFAANAAHSLTPQDFLRLSRQWAKKHHQPLPTKAQVLSALPTDIHWQNTDESVRNRVLAWLQVKPIRTLSGVATVTLLTKPWPCPGECIFCPSDVRMPKSYLANEPGAARAEANFFDPLLQICSRLDTLSQMGHPLDKIEIIILGGTWDAYPLAYRLWFVSQVFHALNLFGHHRDEVERRRQFYETLSQSDLPLSANAQNNAKIMAVHQQKIDNGHTNYNRTAQQVYLGSHREQTLSQFQTATWATLARQQDLNVTAAHRNVGLVIETRPDCITPAAAAAYRRLGATKIQLGVQSVNDDILRLNGRHLTSATIAQAFAILRLFGFKIHAHFMANLLAAPPEGDIHDFAQFVSDKRFLPDEIKLYPCALLRSAPLYHLYEAGRYQPYTSEQLLTVLVANVTATPPYTRITRMIRDFSSHDIVAGNKHTNFRHLVDHELAKQNIKPQEIRSREIKNETIDPAKLTLDEIHYATNVSDEYFLQFVTPEHKIVGFLRLSLPKTVDSPEILSHLPWLTAPSAMIREVHVYGSTSTLGAHTNA